MKKFLSLLLAVCLVICGLPISAGAATEGETYYVTMGEGFFTMTDGSKSPALAQGDWEFTYGSSGIIDLKFAGESSKTHDIAYPGLTYDDAWFAKDSTTNQFPLAQLSAGFVFSGGASEENDTYKDINAYNFLTSMGFDTGTSRKSPGSYTAIGYNKADDHTVGMVMATKSIPVYQGQDTLLAVCLRGKGYGNGGWAGNFTVGASGQNHDGFNRAADYALDQINNYITQHKLDKSRLRIWLTGYSRSAATANLLSAKLRDTGVCEGKRIFTYTFATPNNQTAIHTSKNTYDNIYNYINPSDIVPLVPLLQWDFGKLGTTYHLPKLEGKYASPVKAEFSTLTGGQTYATPYHNTHMLTWISETVADAIPDRATFYKYAEPFMVEFYKKNKDVAAMDADIVRKFAGDKSKLVTIIDAIKRVTEKDAEVGYRIGAAARAVTELDGYLATIPSDSPMCSLVTTVKYVLAGFVAESALYVTGNDIDYYNLELIDTILRLVLNEDGAVTTEHWPEVYMAWMMNITEKDVTKDSTCREKIIVVRCPVDVEVYDASGKLVAKVAGDVPQEIAGSSVTAAVYGISDKVIVLPQDQEYQVKITATGGGTMDYSVYESAAGNDPLRTVSIHDIPLKTGDVFTGEVDKEPYTPASNYVLARSGDKKAFYPDYDSIESSFFDDVSSSAWYYTAVKWAVREGITQGTSATRFSPNNPCTRGEMVEFLYRAAGKPAVSGSNAFTDIPSNAYYKDAVQWAVDNGITSGTSATTFSPKQKCSRGQMAAFLYRYAKQPLVYGSNPFKDVPASAYYRKAVQWAASKGITVGTSETTFNPNGDCTRGQMATFLYRLLGQ